MSSFSSRYRWHVDLATAVGGMIVGFIYGTIAGAMGFVIGSFLTDSSNPSPLVFWIPFALVTIGFTIYGALDPIWDQIVYKVQTKFKVQS